MQDKKFIIAVDSSCDMPLKECKEKDYEAISFTYAAGDEQHLDSMDPKDFKKFYQEQRNGKVWKTSQINPQEYYKFFLKLEEQHLPIIFISLGSGLSNSVNNAKLAYEMLLEEGHQLNLFIVDSKLASLGLGLLADRANQYRKEGKSFEETCKYLDEITPQLNTFYTTETLTYFARGGRLSKASALIGNAFRINPILDCDPAGHLRITDKVRGSNRAIKTIIARIKTQVVNPEEQVLYVCHADAAEKADTLVARILAEIPFKGVHTTFMGPIIGSHTGPGLVSIYFLGKPRPEKIIPIAEINEQLLNTVKG